MQLLNIVLKKFFEYIIIVTVCYFRENRPFRRPALLLVSLIRLVSPRVYIRLVSSTTPFYYYYYAQTTRHVVVMMYGIFGDDATKRGWKNEIIPWQNRSPCRERRKNQTDPGEASRLPSPWRTRLCYMIINFRNNATRR